MESKIQKRPCKKYEFINLYNTSFKYISLITPMDWVSGKDVIIIQKYLHGSFFYRPLESTGNRRVRLMHQSVWSNTCF